MKFDILSLFLDLTKTSIPNNNIIRIAFGKQNINVINTLDFNTSINNTSINNTSINNTSINKNANVNVKATTTAKVEQ